MTLRYINTDLDVVGEFDLATLALEFERRGLYPLSAGLGADLSWRARFETLVDHGGPEACIRAMLDVIETMSAESADAWRSCAVREFNLGFSSGRAPGPVEHGLGNSTLRRIADVGASLGMTVYPLVEG